MKKIIKRFNIILLAGAITLTFGCGIDELIDDLREELKDYAPFSMSGKDFYGTRSSKTGYFVDNPGSFTLHLDASTYNLLNTGATVENGTYTYSKKHTNMGRIVLTDPNKTEVVTYELTFTSETGGSYSATVTGGVIGQEIGIFTLAN